MNEVVFNDGDLSINDVDKVVRKVRGIVINRNTNKVLLVRYAGLYMLPGGSIDLGEDELDALKREILEESGIEVEDGLIKPYLVMKSFDKNYYDRKSGIINRLTETTFFEVYTDKEIDNSKKKLTESEKDKGHVISFVNLDNIPSIVKDNVTDNNKRYNFDREILWAVLEYKKSLGLDKVKVKK